MLDELAEHLLRKALNMPTNKKKLVRERMAKTGESYATALKALRKEVKAAPPPAAKATRKP